MYTNLQSTVLRWRQPASKRASKRAMEGAREGGRKGGREGGKEGGRSEGGTEQRKADSNQMMLHQPESMSEAGMLVYACRIGTNLDTEVKDSTSRLQATSFALKRADTQLRNPGTKMNKDSHQ